MEKLIFSGQIRHEHKTVSYSQENLNSIEFLKKFDGTEFSVSRVSLTLTTIKDVDEAIELLSSLRMNMPNGYRNGRGIYSCDKETKRGDFVLDKKNKIIFVENEAGRYTLLKTKA